MPEPSATAAAAAAAPVSLSRWSVYGDIWMRYLGWGARHCPSFFEPLFIALYTVVFFFVARRQRRAISRNLSVLLPGSSALANYFRAFRVFWNFAWTIADAARVQDGQDVIAWEVDGIGNFQHLAAETGGIIILTGHMGNYDVAAPLFGQRFQRKLHAVRIPEKHAALQAYMEETRDRRQSGTYQIHYNRPGNLLALELAQALSRQEMVAIQGDRVMENVAAMEVPFRDRFFRLPKGPFVLALASHAPVYPLFVIRLGWRRYRVQLFPALPVPVNPRDREASMRQLAEKWCGILTLVARQHWQQWFVLEDAFRDASTQPNDLPT